MQRTGRNFVLVTLIACFAVFFGVDIATKGIEELHGPLPDALPTTSSESPTYAAALVDPIELERQRLLEQLAQLEAEQRAREQAETDAERVYQQQLERALSQQGPYGDTLINRMADSTGFILRGTVQKGVEIFVAMIDGILD